MDKDRSVLSQVLLITDTYLLLTAAEHADDAETDRLDSECW